MTSNELRRRFPEAHEDFIKLNADDYRPGPLSQLQELKDDNAGKVDNRPKEAEVDGCVHPVYRVAVTQLVSDDRDRDGDGAYTTLQDCLIAAIGRLAQMDRLALRKLAKSEERRGRRSDND